MSGMSARWAAGLLAVMLTGACGDPAPDTAAPTVLPPVTTVDSTAPSARPGDEGVELGSSAFGGVRADGSTDNEWPANYLLFTDRKQRQVCKVFILSSEAGSPVTITKVSLSRSAMFRLAPPCSGQGEPACEGFTIQPGAEEVRCEAAFSITAGTRRSGTADLAFHYRARCTSAEGVPCRDPKVAAARPSAARPVTVRWEARFGLAARSVECTRDEHYEGACPDTRTDEPTPSVTPSVTPTKPPSVTPTQPPIESPPPTAG